MRKLLSDRGAIEAFGTSSYAVEDALDQTYHRRHSPYFRGDTSRDTRRTLPPLPQNLLASVRVRLASHQAFRTLVMPGP